MTIPSDEIIGQLKLGAVLRAADGRRFVIKSIRKVNDGKEANMMHTTSDDAITEITKLEQQVNDLESLLDSAVGKQADAGEDDDDNADDTIEVAKLQSKVAELGKTLTDAIAAADKSAADTFDRVADDIAKRDGCSRLVALQKARLEAPEQFRRYQMAGIEIAKARPSGRSNGPSQFELLARTIRQQGKLSGTQALAKARAADPQAFADYQAGK
jgi:hypothetical protein